MEFILRNRQNARNRLIANIFKLYGLVECSSQGMNWIYETSINEAKPLPDFNVSNASFMMTTINGRIINRDILSFINKINEKRVEAMTTSDYLLLLLLCTQNGDAKIDHTQYEHFTELGIRRFTERGIELFNNDATFPIDYQLNGTVDWRSIESKDKGIFLNLWLQTAA